MIVLAAWHSQQSCLRLGTACYLLACSLTLAIVIPVLRLEWYSLQPSACTGNQIVCSLALAREVILLTFSRLALVLVTILPAARLLWSSCSQFSILLCLLMSTLQTLAIRNVFVPDIVYFLILNLQLDASPVLWKHLSDTDNLWLEISFYVLFAAWRLPIPLIISAKHRQFMTWNFMFRFICSVVLANSFDNLSMNTDDLWHEISFMSH